MRAFKIVTDNTCDLPKSYVKENDLTLLWLSYIMDGVTYSEDYTLPYPEGCDILHIAFSSGLSGSCNSARIAAEELKEEYPDAQIVVVDSLCASLGEGLLVHKAVQMKKAGKSLAEIDEWLENNKRNLCHVFTVDDLNHLYRGGRVSRTQAVLGTLVNIKPMLHVDDEGKLIAVGKVRGRKKSITALVDMMEERMKSRREENDIVFISHGDCMEDALLLKKQVEERFGIQAFLIDYVGPTIGAHSGPGTLALFFMGEKR